MPVFNPDNMNLSWKGIKGKGHDANIVIPDWKYLDEFIAKLPDPAKLPGWDGTKKIAEEVHKKNIYLSVGWKISCVIIIVKL